MARHISTNYRLKSSVLNTTHSTTSTISNKPNNQQNSNSSTISNNYYNEILSKLNNYALKTSLNEFITQQDLNSTISNIKQCNCEHQTINTGSVDNNALNALLLSI